MGLGLGAKMMTSGTAHLMNIPWGLCHHCPCHAPASAAVEPQPTPASSGDLAKPTSWFVLDSCGVTALLWVSGHRNLMCALQGDISASFSPMELLHPSPSGLESQMLPTNCRPQAEELDVGLGTLPPVEETVMCVFSSSWIACPIGMGFDFITRVPLLLSGGFLFVFESRISVFW